MDRPGTSARTASAIMPRAQCTPSIIAQNPQTVVSEEMVNRTRKTVVSVFMLLSGFAASGRTAICTEQTACQSRQIRKAGRNQPLASGIGQTRARCA
jgi:hypothetical protein